MNNSVKALSIVCFFSVTIMCINKEVLIETLEKKIDIPGIQLSPSLHGGDNTVFFIKKDNSVIGIAKCYTKRTIEEVEKTYQISHLLSQELPIPRVIGIFLHNQTPVVLQTFLRGQHYEHLNSEQHAEVARNMAKIHRVTLATLNLTINTTEFDYQSLLKLCPCFPDYTFISELYASLDLRYLHNLPLSIIHGDFSGSNILFESNKISGIIDLDHARYSYRLTDIARAQVFFSFDSDGALHEDKVKDFLKAYNGCNVISPEELTKFYDHLKLLLIKMALETYYYVEVRKEVSPEIFKTSSFNQSWQLLLKKLHAIENRTSITLC